MEQRIADVRGWVEENDAHLFRQSPLQIAEIRDARNGVPGSYAIEGTAAVCNKWSLDLGGFRERNLPGAFDRVLSEDPHVIHTWDHDTARALSSTRSKQFPLELKALNDVLGFYSRVAPTTDAANLRILMEGGIVDQSSYAFTVRESEWRYLEEEDILERDIVEIEGLYDVTTCAMGAFPQTDSQIAVRSLLKGAKRSNGVFITNTFPTTATNATDFATAVTTSFGTRTVGAEGNAEPADEPAPEEDPEAPSATPEPAPDEGGAPPANEPEQPEAQPEDREAKEREFKLWQQKRAAEHRRTREFAFGVVSQQEEKTK